MGEVCQLLIESECLELPAPFRRQIAEPLDADAAGQATFQGSSDKIGRAFLARFRLVEIKRLFRESIPEGLYPLVLDVRVEQSVSLSRQASQTGWSPLLKVRADAF
jgi:hypothetical protein